ncbi:MAG: cation:proton antiporter [Verrucomicrobiota bacterium]|nr:cation:proton antiporter [Verrucomicrobiota bacterium]
MNSHITIFQAWFSSFHLPILLIVGFAIIVGFYSGKTTNLIRLPSIIGYMLIGLILGPSFVNLISHEVQHNLSFITEVALGFVALSIGLELSLISLKRQGMGIVSIIFIESFAAFIITTVGLYILTKDVPLSLIFGSFAPASAPAGTVAIIKEYKAKGSLTKALYAVVGFDDGLAIIIFGFVAAIVRMLLVNQTSANDFHLIHAMLEPLQEIILSFAIGSAIAVLLILLIRKINNKEELLILTVGFILFANGLCTIFHMSLILTNMIIGLIIVNTQPRELVHKIGDILSSVMPLFFILFFALAGANLHISALPSLGMIGIVYILCRTAGLVGGASLGATIGKVEPKIKKYIGMGILSQAGVAIGLALIVKQEFQGLGRVVEIVNSVQIHTGDMIGTVAITTVTATCIFFEIVGPILTKIGLTKAGEITNKKILAS